MMIADEPHVVVHLNRFRQYPETGMEYLIMARKTTAAVSAPVAPVAVDATAQLLELLRGLNPAQLGAVLAQLAPAPVAPVAPAPVAPVAPVELPTAKTRDVGAGTIADTFLCISVSPVRWSRYGPSRIVNFVHEADDTGFVAYENGTETDFRPGKRYSITGTCPGKMSPVYQGVSNNIIKIATSVAI
jgi:hypothetical protein